MDYQTGTQKVMQKACPRMVNQMAMRLVSPRRENRLGCQKAMPMVYLRLGYHLAMQTVTPMVCLQTENHWAKRMGMLTAYLLMGCQKDYRLDSHWAYPPMETQKVTQTGLHSANQKVNRMGCRSAIRWEMPTVFPQMANH